MPVVKVIKKPIQSYDVLKSAQDIAFDADRAVSDFRAFYPIASFHASNVSDPRALDVLIEVIENVRATLLSRQRSAKPVRPVPSGEMHVKPNSPLR